MLSLDELGDRISRQHQFCLDNPATALVAGCQLGALLQQAQQLCAPQQWEQWLATRCGLSLDAAQTYLQVAQSWGVSEVSTSPSPPPKMTPKPPPKPVTPPSSPPIPKTPTSSPPTATPPVTSQPLKLFLPGIVVPKARPRVTRFGTFMPPRYRNWRLQAEGELILQVQRMTPVPSLPIERATVRIRFQGKFRAQADLDNLAGAILDALTLQGAGILKNDNLSCVPSLSVEYLANDAEPGAHIEIFPIDSPGK